jgi:hypothetical protein
VNSGETIAKWCGLLFFFPGGGELCCIIPTKQVLFLRQWKTRIREERREVAQDGADGADIGVEATADFCLS